MKRRRFLRRTSAAGAFAVLASPLPSALPSPSSPGTFGLDFAPHLGLFAETAGDGIADQIAFMADAGFRSMEDNTLRRRPTEDQALIGRELARWGMRLGVFVVDIPEWRERPPMLTDGDPAYVDHFLDAVRSSSDLAADVGATWMTVVPGHVAPRLSLDLQTAHVIDALRRAADVVAPRGQVLVIEPLNTLVNHPQIFLRTIPQAYAIARAVDSPGLKVLADVYHEQIEAGNLIHTLDACWDEVAYVQVGDTPGRREPGTGEIHYGNVFQWLYEKGYQGVVGMEHRAAVDGVEGERAVIEAYRRLSPPTPSRLFARPD